MNFLTKLYPLALTRKIENLLPKSKTSKFEWNSIYDAFTEYYTENFDNIDRTKFKPVDNHGYDIYFAILWNKWIKEKNLKEYEKQRLINCLKNDFADRLIMTKSLSKDGKFQRKEFLKASKMFRADDHMVTCSLTGKRLFSFVRNNEIVLEDFGKGLKIITPKRNSFKNKLYEVEVEFKTGNLLIMDWFRVEDDIFTNLVRKDKDFSINYTKGRVDQINYYAKEFNFVSVNVGNSCPKIFKEDSDIIIGYSETEEDLGFVCTDLWNASVIDEAQLEEHLVSGGLALKKAKSEIKKMKKEWTCNEIKVKAGKYKLYFCGNYDEFNKKFRKNHSLSDKYEPYLVIKKI